jgi:hypothetical protein
VKTSRPILWPAVFLLVSCLTGSILSLRKVDGLRGGQATLQEVLYIRSGKTLKRLSLGYSGLMADIYWTRAVQYFGSRVQVRSAHYELLYPLLDITTDLDPHLIVAYQNGAVFLSGRPPSGAGRPDKAVELLEKGIHANPAYWRLYFTLGFVHYMDRKDYKAAQEAFEKGASVPGALVWMKVMAATMAGHAGDASTAVALWTRLYESTQDEKIRKNALQHITALRVDQDVAELERRISEFSQRTGRVPSNWSDLVSTGLLKGVPVDPNKIPYRLMSDGTVQVRDPDSLPFITRGLAPGTKPKRPL